MITVHVERLVWPPLDCHYGEPRTKRCHFGCASALPGGDLRIPALPLKTILALGLRRRDEAHWTKRRRRHQRCSVERPIKLSVLRHRESRVVDLVESPIAAQDQGRTYTAANEDRELPDVPALTCPLSRSGSVTTVHGRGWPP